MGETQEGEGRSRQATTTDLAAHIVREMADAGIIVDRVHVQYVTAGLYACEVTERGSNEPERYFVTTDDEPDA